MTALFFNRQRDLFAEGFIYCAGARSGVLPDIFTSFVACSPIYVDYLLNQDF
jgi:hypothetical protein